VVRVAVVSSGLVRLPPMRDGAVEEYVHQLVKHSKNTCDTAAVNTQEVKLSLFKEFIS